MSTIGIVTINNGRPRIFNLFCESIKRLRKEMGDMWIPCVCVSGEEDKAICQRYNISHITQENHPATEKWNTAARLMMDVGVDAIMILGSDDIISTAYFKAVLDKVSEGYDLIGTNHLYVYDTDGDHRGELLGLTSKGHFGVGLTIKAEIFKKLNCQPWDYPIKRSYGMDAILYKNISPHIRSKAMIDGVIVDCKSRQNINKYTAFKKNYGGRVEPVSTFYDFLSQEEKDILASIKHIAIPKFQRVHKRGRTKI